MNKVVSEIGSIINVYKSCAEQINGWFLCNGNTSLKWQCGSMDKVNISIKILLIASSSKQNEKLQPGR